MAKRTKYASKWPDLAIQYCLRILIRANVRSNLGVQMRKEMFDGKAAKRAVNLSLNSDLLDQARAQGLNLSAVAEEAVAAALARRMREKLLADIVKGCEVHEVYLAEYGSLGDAVRANADAPK